MRWSTRDPDMMPSHPVIQQNPPMLEVYIGTALKLEDLFEMSQASFDCACFDHNPNHKYCPECGKPLGTGSERIGEFKFSHLFGGAELTLNEDQLGYFLAGHCFDLRYQGKYEAHAHDCEEQESTGLHSIHHEGEDILLLGHKLESVPIPLTRIAQGLSTRHSWTGMSMNFNFAKELLEEFGLESRGVLGHWIVIR